MPFEFVLTAGNESATGVSAWNVFDSSVNAQLVLIKRTILCEIFATDFTNEISKSERYYILLLLVLRGQVYDKQWFGCGLENAFSERTVERLIQWMRSIDVFSEIRLFSELLSTTGETTFKCLIG